jgi:hypothetical protein
VNKIHSLSNSYREKYWKNTISRPAMWHSEKLNDVNNYIRLGHDKIKCG